MKAIDILLEPTFRYSRDSITSYKPTAKEVFKEWIKSVNFFKNLKVIGPGFFSLHHFFTFMAFIYFLVNDISLMNVIFVTSMLAFMVIVYNTVWYHRYCSHASFEFKYKALPLFLLWTNPIVYREESYALAHRVHHQNSDKIGDPYGPHLGWLGSYFANEWVQNLNCNITEKQYRDLTKSLSHIPLVFNDYKQFKRFGCVENIFVYLIRAIFAQVFWATIVVSIFGYDILVPWFTSSFLIAFLLRDFNWRGHGGFRYMIQKDKSNIVPIPLNQPFYGFIASEWHANHHKYPMSANSGFMPGQLDLSFLIIKALHKLGLVTRYFDAREEFLKSQDFSNVKGE